MIWTLGGELYAHNNQQCVVLISVHAVSDMSYIAYLDKLERPSRGARWCVGTVTLPYGLLMLEELNPIALRPVLLRRT